MNYDDNATTKYEINLARTCISELETFLVLLRLEDDFDFENVNKLMSPILEPQIRLIESVINRTNRKELITSYAKVLLASYDFGFLENVWKRTYITEKLLKAGLTITEKNQLMESVKKLVIRTFNHVYETEIQIDACLNAHESIFG